MKPVAKVVLFVAVASLGVTGCTCTFGSPTSTPTPLPTATQLVLAGAYNGGVPVTGTATYSDGTPAVNASRVIPTLLVYNAASVLIQWNRTLPSGTVIGIANPQPGASATYNDTVGGVSGTITATVNQVTYTATSSTVSGTATFTNGSTGYSGTGTFVATAAPVANGATYTIAHSWTITSPGGTQVITVSESGTAVLPRT